MGIGWKLFRQNSVGVERTVDFIGKAIENWRKEYEDYVKGWIGKGV